MKALTLWRPWPWAIFHAQHNPKRIENRPWSPPESMIDEEFALHAGAKFDQPSVYSIMQRTNHLGSVDWRMDQQGIVGTAVLRGWVENAEDAEAFMVGQGEWFSGPFAWLLSDVRALAKPVPCKGFQKLWNLPPDVERQVLEQLR